MAPHPAAPMPQQQHHMQQQQMPPKQPGMPAAGGDNWRNNVQQPAKDNRLKTTVRVCAIAVELCLHLGLSPRVWPGAVACRMVMC